MMSNYKRILLKLSGEALMGQYNFGYDPAVLSQVATEIVAVQQAGTEVALVIGGGNLFRGARFRRGRFLIEYAVIKWAC